MSEIGFARTAELVVVALGGDFVGAADHPGIFGRAVLFELFEQLFEARVELANRAIAVEAQRNVARRGHVLVYAIRRAPREKRMTVTRQSPGQAGSQKR